MADLLVDTDIFIDHLRGAVELRPGKHRLHYSVITRAELSAGNSASVVFATLLAPFREVAVDRAPDGSPSPVGAWPVEVPSWCMRSSPGSSQVRR